MHSCQEKNTACINDYAKQAIELLQIQIAHLGYKPAIHFELEGTYDSEDKQPFRHNLNFSAINNELAKYSMQGILKPEFWSCQWEWVSNFEGQTPLKSAQNLEMAIHILPLILKKHGAKEVFIKPVMWNAAQGRMINGSRNIFSVNALAIHVPNAIHINISAFNQQNQNAIPDNDLGEKLQLCLLETSYECCLLYSPEEEAFARLTLKEKFNLSQELSSPKDLSGGHQGSIALYKEIGKHNQKMGEQPLLYNSDNQVISSVHNWRPLSRIEHRLGSASVHYNPYVNTVFALANLSDALMTDSIVNGSNKVYKSLPLSLFDENHGAYVLFSKGTWFENKINACVQYITANRLYPSDKIPKKNLGTLLKHAILAYYNAFNCPLAGLL